MQHGSAPRSASCGRETEMGDRVTVGLGESRRFVREVLGLRLAAEDGLRVVASAESHELALLYATGGVDVVVCDAALDATHSVHAIHIDDNESITSLIARIHDAANRTPGAASAAHSHPTRRAVPRLGRRETQVLSAMASGASTREIADALGISAKTVENHRQRIYAKLGVHNKGHAVALAIREGIIAATKTPDPATRTR